MIQRKYQRLTAWQKAMELAEQVYLLTEQMPKSEQYGLRGQMCRAAVSVPSNIAEGAGRASDKDFLRFLYIARGSLQELETQMLLAARIYSLNEVQPCLNKIDQVFAILNGLATSLKTKIRNERPTSDFRRQTSDRSKL